MAAQAKTQAKQTNAKEAKPAVTDLSTLKAQPLDVINAEIDKIAKTAEKLGTQIHNIAMQCMLHGWKHGNFTPMTRLYKQLHASQRRESLKNWFVAFAPVMFDAEGGQFLKDDIATNKKFDLEAALKTPYYAFEKEKVERVLTIEQVVAMVKRLVKQRDDSQAKGKDDPESKAAYDLIDRIAAVLPANESNEVASEQAA